MRYLVVVLLILAGCASQERIRARQEAYTENLRQRCVAFGFTEQNYIANCMLQLDAHRQAIQAQNSALMLQQGMSMMEASGPRPIGAQPAVVPNVHCTPTVGGGVQCRSF